MHRITKLLIAAIAFAAVQTINAVAVFRNVVGFGSAAFCWFVVLVVAWRRSLVR